MIINCNTEKKRTFVCICCGRNQIRLRLTCHWVFQMNLVKNALLKKKSIEQNAVSIINFSLVHNDNYIALLALIFYLKSEIFH